MSKLDDEECEDYREKGPQAELGAQASRADTDSSDAFGSESSGVDVDLDELTKGIEVSLMGGRHGQEGGRKRPDNTTRDLTQGSIPKNLWFLAWPQMVEGVLNMVDQFWDLFWAGRVGVGAIAGLGVAQQFTGLVMTGRMGLDTGMQAMISRAVGIGNIPLANHVTLQSFTLTGLFSLIMVGVGVWITEDLLRIVGISQETIGIGASYMRIQFIGTATMAFRMMSGGALQAAGDAVTPMKATAAARVAHILLTPLLMFGWFIPEFSGYSLAGAAIANVVAHSIGAIWNVTALFAGTSRLRLTLKGYSVDLRMIWRLTKVGAPASGTGMERNLAQLVLVRLVTSFGDSAVAAFSLTRRLEMLTMMGSMGFGRASGVLVGQNLGAGHPDRAKQTVVWAAAYVTAIRGGLGLLLIIFPVFFISIFSNDPELLNIAAPWVQIQAIGGLVMGGGFVLQQSFNIAGDTIAVMIMTFISMWLVEVPLAYMFSRHTSMGQYGIPTATALSMATRVAIYIYYFFKGRWLEVQVLDEKEIT